MKSTIQTYKGFDIEVILSEIDDVVRYRAYNPQENYMLFDLEVDGIKKKIDEWYKSR